LYYQFESRGMIQHHHVIGEKGTLFEAASDLWAFIEHRQQIKQQKVFAMLAYIESETCLNERLYASFTSNGHVKRKHCCMHCHFTLDDWDVKQMMYNKHEKNNDWKQLLARKLSIGENE